MELLSITWTDQRVQNQLARVVLLWSAGATEMSVTLAADQKAYNHDM